MYSHNETNSPNRYLKEIKTLMKDFDIKYTEEMDSHIKSLLPDRAAVERYTRKLIRERLEKYDY